MVDNARVRVGHCCPDAPTVDIHVDGDPAFTDIAYKDTTDYAEIEAGRRHIEVVPTGESEPVIDESFSFDEATEHTALATGLLSEAELTVLTDDPGRIPSDQAELRCVHAAPDAPSVDIRAAGGSMIAENLAFRSASEYEQLDAGEYTIEIMPAGSNEVVLEVDGITLSDQTAYSALAVGQMADDSLEALMLEDAQQMVPADDD